MGSLRRSDAPAMFYSRCFEWVAAAAARPRRPPACWHSHRSLAIPPPLTILACFTSRPAFFPQDLSRAARLFRSAADASTPEERNMRWRRFTRTGVACQSHEGGSAPDGASPRAGVVDAQVEYAIALFNGAGVAKDEAQAAKLLREAAMRQPVTGSRLARLLAAGQGVSPTRCGGEMASDRQGRGCRRRLSR
ncbi:MAG: hypothetical protein R3D62_08870 [Xanthobacteraceae bacterium]